MFVEINSLDDFCDRKSFYEKCKAVRMDNSIALYSYNYLIALVNNEGRLTKESNYISMATWRHIKAFFKYVDSIHGTKYARDITKQVWFGMPKGE